MDKKKPQLAKRTHPGVKGLEIAMPGVDPVDALRAFMQVKPKTVINSASLSSRKRDIKRPKSGA
jgi:chemotaxis response regulator CheB